MSVDDAEPASASAAAPGTAAGGAPLGGVASFFLTPGVTPGALRVMNGSFAGLFLSLLFLYLVSRSGHVLLLLAVTAALFASVQWFLIELDAADKRKEALGGEPAGSSVRAKTTATPTATADARVSGSAAGKRKLRKM